MKDICVQKKHVRGKNFVHLKETISSEPEHCYRVVRSNDNARRLQKWKGRKEERPAKYLAQNAFASGSDRFPREVSVIRPRVFPEKTVIRFCTDKQIVDSADTVVMSPRLCRNCRGVDIRLNLDGRGSGQEQAKKSVHQSRSGWRIGLHLDQVEHNLTEIQRWILQQPPDTLIRTKILKGLEMNRSVRKVSFIIPLVLLFGCSDRKNNSPLTKESSERIAGGISWSYPSRWQSHPPRPMRAATYLIPHDPTDSSDGECAVFYFGKGQGGDVDLNIKRWGSQFESVNKGEKSELNISGVKITRVELSGTYLAPSMMTGEASGRLENYVLLGAIAEAPEGMVFFKFTGPSKTVLAAAEEFNAILNSITKL
jgi:hypothetical protein